MANRTGLRRPGLSQDAFLKDIVNAETAEAPATAPEAAQEPSLAAPAASGGGAEEQEDGVERRRSSRRGGVVASTFSQDSVVSGGSRSSSKGARSRGNSADSAKGLEPSAQDQLPRPLSSPKLPRRKGNMAVWFSGDLWKLNSTGRDPKDLMNWRRRYFTLVWDESMGLVLNYASEKEDCKQTLGCIVQGKDPMGAKASLATLQTVDVQLADEDQHGFENSIRTYDIAVHKRSLHDPCDMSVPSVMNQLMVNGVDQDGMSKILILGWNSTEALASWLMVIENAVKHHFNVELVVDHMQATSLDVTLLGLVGGMASATASVPVERGERPPETP